VYKVPLKKIRHKATVRRVQDLLTKSENDKKARRARKRRLGECSEDDSDGDLDEEAGRTHKHQRTEQSQAVSAQEEAPPAQRQPAVDNPVLNALQQLLGGAGQNAAATTNPGGQLLLSQILTSAFGSAALAPGGSGAGAPAPLSAPHQHGGVPASDAGGTATDGVDPKQLAKMERMQKKNEEKEQRAAEKAAAKEIAKEEAAQKKAMAAIDKDNSKVSSLAMKAQLILASLVPELAAASKDAADLPDKVRTDLLHDLKMAEQWAGSVTKIMNQSKKIRKGNALPKLAFELAELSELQKNANRNLLKAKQVRKILT
jgi:hypothetical protein